MQQIVQALFMIISCIFFSSCDQKDQKSVLSSSIDLKKYNIYEALRLENVVPVVVVGSGPAGLSAGLYSARAGFKTFIFAGPMPCGQLTQTTYIENWPGREKIMGLDLMHDIKGQALSFGAHVVHDTVTHIDFNQWPYVIQTDDGRNIKALSIIIATGATPKTLQIPGEKEYWGKGVTTCAVCDAFFFKKKNVVIVGGGDSAIEMVFQLAPYAQSITLLVRKGSMKAADSMQKKLTSIPQVTVEYFKEIHEIQGDGSHVTGIQVYDNQTNKLEHRPIDGVFLAIGHDPNNQLLQGSPVLMDQDGYVVMQGRSQKTTVPGVVAAGEIQDPYYRQAVVAAAEGVKAALDNADFLYQIGFNQEHDAHLDKNFFEQISEQTVSIAEISEDEELQKEVLDASGVVILDFFAPDCPGCMKMIPAFEAVAAKLGDKIKFVKTNMNSIKKTIFPTLWYDHDIKVRRIPAFLVFRDGKFIEMNTNLYSKRELLEYLQKYV